MCYQWVCKHGGLRAERYDLADSTESLLLQVAVVAPAVALTSLATRRQDRFLHTVTGMYGRVTRVGTELGRSGERVESPGMRVGTSRPVLAADQRVEAVRTLRLTSLPEGHGRNVWRRET